MLNFDSDDNKLSKAELNSSRDNSVQSKVIKDRQIKELHRIVRLVRSKLLKCHNKDKNENVGAFPVTWFGYTKHSVIGVWL